LSEVQVVPVCNDIGTDAKVRGPTVQVHCLQGIETDNAVSKRSINWIGVLPCADVRLGRVNVGFHWGIAFEDLYPHNAVIKVRDVVGSEFCIGFIDGHRIFETIIDMISQGRHVEISFENIRSLSAAFLESAIGQLYRCGIPEAKLKEYIIWKQVSPERKLLIERAIAEAKES